MKSEKDAYLGANRKESEEKEDFLHQIRTKVRSLIWPDMLILSDSFYNDNVRITELYLLLCCMFSVIQSTTN